MRENYLSNIFWLGSHRYSSILPVCIYKLVCCYWARFIITIITYCNYYLVFYSWLLCQRVYVKKLHACGRVLWVCWIGTPIDWLFAGKNLKAISQTLFRIMIRIQCIYKGLISICISIYRLPSVVSSSSITISYEMCTLAACFHSSQ